MLLPSQQAANTYLTDFMRAFARNVEERNEADKKKAEGKREDKQQEAIRAQIQPDQSATAANAKINAHFFGALKSDENPLAALISRVTDAMGLTQGTDETASDFADRLSDAVSLTALVAREYAGGEKLPITLKTLRVSADNVADIMQGKTSETDSTNARLAARIGLAAGVDTKSETFSDDMGTALTEARGKLPKSIDDVEEQTGLRKLGLNIRDVIAAIRQPWGDAARKITDALDAQAANERTLTKDVAKAIQRLQDVADPKSVAELKAERTRDDPTRVEDAETRAEREDDIKAREAQEKVEDVKKRQDAIGERIRAADDPQAKTDGDVTTGDVTAGATEIIQVLAAGAQADAAAQAAPTADTKQAEPRTPVDDGDPTTLSREEQAYIVENHTPEAAAKAQDAANADVLRVGVDDIGLYRLIGKDKKAA